MAFTPMGAETARAKLQQADYASPSPLAGQIVDNRSDYERALNAIAKARNLCGSINDLADMLVGPRNETAGAPAESPAVVGKMGDLANSAGALAYRIEVAHRRIEAIYEAFAIAPQPAGKIGG